MKPVVGILAGAVVLFATACSSSSSSTAPVIRDTTASDDFERAQLGSDWKELTIPSVAGIVGNSDLGTLAAGFTSLDWVGDVPFDADQFSEIVVAAGKSSNMLVQVHVRRQSSNVRYGFHFNSEKAPAVFEIKHDGGTVVRILTSVAGPALAGGDVIRIEARGREISGYLNGQRLLVATDNASSAILGAGGTGITARLKTGTTTTYPAPIVARWSGGSLP